LIYLKFKQLLWLSHGESDLNSTKNVYLSQLFDVQAESAR